MICIWSGPSGFNCWSSVAPAFQSWFAVEYSSYFISVMNFDLYVRCFDSLISRGPSRGSNNFDASVVVYSNCLCSSAFCLSLTYCSIYLG